MNKYEYKEPLFNAVISSSQDVITTSDPTAPAYNQGQFESEQFPIGF